MTVTEKEMVKATYRDEDGKLFDQNGTHVVDTDDFDAVLNEIRDTVNRGDEYGIEATTSALDRLQAAQHVAYMAAHLVHLSINQLTDKYRNEHGVQEVLKF